MQGFPPKQARVFVATSSKTAVVGEAIKTALASDEIVVEPWKDLGVFPLSEHTIESLEKASNQCQFAVFVLGPDDIMVREDGKSSVVVRDNVIFELGLFLGKIGRKRSYMLKPTGVEIELPSDLSGVTWAGYTNMDGRGPDVRDACDKIRHAMKHAPMTPVGEILAATVLPEIVIRHALREFRKGVVARIKLFARPRFRCDAQITRCTRKGRIVGHPRISSLGHNVEVHEGRIIWSTLPFERSDRPFKLLLQNSDVEGWVVWSDTGYSQLYAPIAGRHNYRICAARSHWTTSRMALLEIHQEIATQLDPSSLLELGHIVGGRILKVEGEP